MKHPFFKNYGPFNLDNLLKGEFFGIIPFFNSEGKNWSFLKIKNKIVIEVKEKERISNNCSVGTYFFKNSEEFYSLAKEYINHKKNEYCYQKVGYWTCSNDYSSLINRF